MFTHFVSLMHEHMHNHRYWRSAPLSEISELYIATTLRSLALSMVGIFIPVYLYSLGYQLAEICMLYIVTYGARLFTDQIIAKISIALGLHTMISISYLLVVALLFCLAAVELTPIPLPLIGILQALSLGTFFVPFFVDFAAYSHRDQAGKELSSIVIYQKIAAVLGPLVGGLVAYSFGMKYTLILSAVVLVIAVISMLIGNKPQKEYFSYKPKIVDIFEYKKNLGVMLGFSWAQAIDTLVWPLYVATVILSGDKVYASLGLIAAISVSVSVGSSYLIGKAVDNNKTNEIKHTAAFVAVVANVFRNFVNTILGVLSLNIVIDPAASANSILLSKGMLSVAESYKKKRVNAIVTLLQYINVGRLMIWSSLYLLASFLTDQQVLRIGFLIGLIGAALFGLSGFYATNNKRVS